MRWSFSSSPRRESGTLRRSSMPSWASSSASRLPFLPLRRVTGYLGLERALERRVAVAAHRDVRLGPAEDRLRVLDPLRHVGLELLDRVLDVAAREEPAVVLVAR